MPEPGTPLEAEKLRIKKIADDAQLRSIREKLTKGQSLAPWDEEFLAQQKQEEARQLEVYRTTREQEDVLRGSLEQLQTKAQANWEKMESFFAPLDLEDIMLKTGELHLIAEFSPEELLRKVIFFAEETWREEPNFFRAIRREVLKRKLLKPTR